MSQQDGYRGPVTCRLVGITYRQLDYWARTQLILPSIASATGSGTQRRYSYGDLVELKVVKRLLDAGVSLQSARRAVEQLREQLGGGLDSATLVIRGGGVQLARSDGEILDLVRSGDGTLVCILPLGSVVAELDAAIQGQRGTVSA